MIWDVFWGFNGVILGSIPVLAGTYLSDGVDTICRTMWSAGHSCSSVVELLEIACLLDGDASISKAKIACGRMRVWRGCDKVFGASIDGA